MIEQSDQSWRYHNDDECIVGKILASGDVEIEVGTIGVSAELPHGIFLPKLVAESLMEWLRLSCR